MQLLGASRLKPELRTRQEWSRALENKCEMAESHKKKKKGRDELGRAEAKLGPLSAIITALAGGGFPCRSPGQLRFGRWIDLSSSLD